MKSTEIINQLRSREREYVPNDELLSRLATKKLVCLVSPAAAGKSTLMNRIIELDERFARISGLTTRQIRSEDEPGMYRYIPHTDAGLSNILQKVLAGNLVQYAIHPTTGNVYATELQDYPNQYNLKDVLGHAIHGFRALPSAGIYTFGIVCEPNEWRERLAKRYPNVFDAELQKRLAEAKINLAWSLQDSTTIWVDNSNGRLDTAATTIIQLATSIDTPSSTQQANLRNTAQDMLDSI